MIERDDERIRLGNPELGWNASHADNAFGGPRAVTLAGSDVLQDCRNCVDDLDDAAMVVTACKAYRRGGSGIVETEGYFPFGGEIGMRQVCRYAANHVRVTLDINWPRHAVVRRRLGVGSLFLPGQWQRFLVLPPALHAAAGSEPRWRAVPTSTEADAKPLTIGQWHRPPPAMVFERADGTRVEVGTGSDLWRWEQSLGYGPEAASFRVIAEDEGVRLVREPLVCCEEYEPKPRPYRFTWYAAWRPRSAPGRAAPDGTVLDIDGSPVGADHTDATREKRPVVLDLTAGKWPKSAFRVASTPDYILGRRLPSLCWQANSVTKRARRFIRRLAADPSPGRLHIRGLTPGMCWNPAHVGKRCEDGLPHWDIGPLLDWSSWARQQLGPDWDITFDRDPAWEVFPSFAGLFGPNGFDAGPEVDDQTGLTQ